MGAIIAAYLSHCAVAAALLREPQRSRRAQVRAIGFWSGLALRLLGVRVVARALSPAESGENAPLLVCNHQSYLDVIALSSVRVAAFVTSVEVRMSGLLGVITRLGGCLFVERRSREGLPREKEQIAAVLRAGVPVFLFPEGTSSDGSGVLPFKTALFDCAILAGSPVQPVVLKYRRINGVAPSRELLDKALYYGEQEFLPQFLALLTLRSVEVELVYLPSISTVGLLTDGTGRKALATTTHSLISETYGSLTRS
jgi:1-acyl-sn-glycerol-3-phosphate acyltransferase